MNDDMKVTCEISDWNAMTEMFSFDEYGWQLTPEQQFDECFHALIDFDTCEINYHLLLHFIPDLPDVGEDMSAVIGLKFNINIERA